MKKQGPFGKPRHKLMVIDGQVVIAGSFNYTRNANKLNDENIMILGDLDTESNEARKPGKRGTWARKGPAFNGAGRIPGN